MPVLGERRALDGRSDRFDDTRESPPPILGDVAVAMMAGSVTAAAWVSRWAPTVVGTWWLIGPALAAAGVARVRHAPRILAAGLVLAALGLGVRAWSGLVPPPVAGRVQATLVADPVEVAGGSVRVDVRIAGKRVEGWARGDDSRRLRVLLAGERITADCHPRPVAEAQRLWAATRHVGSRCNLGAVGPGPPANWPDATANRFRRLVERGAVSLPPDQRALFTGMTYGDDRRPRVDVETDFDAAGLTHLLAVSGQNVAFVLVVAGPLLRRFGRTGRVVVGAVTLTLFAVVVRFEPSVLRAVVMAVLALGSLAAGRPQPSARRLAAAVIVLVLIDPLLAISVGFGLSVSASAALAVLGQPLQKRFGDLVGTTVAAQVGVAPLLTFIGGDLPLASVPANVLAVPVAGLMSGWGLAAGGLAGLVPGPLAAVVHLPTRLGLWWVRTVAGGAASLPLGRVGPVPLVVAVVAALAAWRLPARARLLGAVAGVLVVGTAAVGVLFPAPLEGSPLVEGVRAWRRGGHVVLVIGGRADPKRLARALRGNAVTRAEVVVVTTSGSSLLPAVETVLRTVTVELLVGPPLLDVAGATAGRPGGRWQAGGLRVELTAAAPERLEVRVD